MYVPNLMRFQHSQLEKCGFLTRGVNECCTRCTENTYITKIDFHREKWCGNKCTKFEMKRLYRCEDVLLSVTCNFYSDKIITPQARFCWTLSHMYIIIIIIISYCGRIRSIHTCTSTWVLFDKTRVHVESYLFPPWTLNPSKALTLYIFPPWTQDGFYAI